MNEDLDRKPNKKRRGREPDNIEVIDGGFTIAKNLSATEIERRRLAITRLVLCEEQNESAVLSQVLKTHSGACAIPV